MTDVPATTGSGTRHTIPHDLREGAARLQLAVSRYAKAMNHPWAADEVTVSSSGLLVEIAREALVTQERHAKWIAEIWGIKTDGA